MMSGVSPLRILAIWSLRASLRFFSRCTQNLIHMRLRLQGQDRRVQIAVFNLQLGQFGFQRRSIDHRPGKV